MIRTCYVGIDDSCAIVREVHVFAGNTREDLAGRRAKVYDIVSSDSNGDWSAAIGKAVKRYVSTISCISWTSTHISVMHAPFRSGTPNGMAWNALNVATTPG